MGVPELTSLLARMTDFLGEDSHTVDLFRTYGEQPPTDARNTRDSIEHLVRRASPHVLVAVLLDHALTSHHTRGLTRRALDLLSDATQQIQGAATEEDACTLAVLHLDRFGYPECIFSFLQSQGRDQFLVGDTRFAPTERCRQIAMNTRHTIDACGGDLDLLPAVLKAKSPRFIIDSTIEPGPDHELCRVLRFTSQYVVPLLTNSMDIGTIQIDMGQTLHCPAEECRMIDALAASLSLAIDRHRTQLRLAHLTHEFLSNIGLISFASNAASLVHDLNHSMTDYLFKLNAAKSSPELRRNKTCLDFLQLTTTFVKHWYDLLRENLASFRSVDNQSNVQVADIVHEVIVTWQKKANTRNCRLRSQVEQSDLAVHGSPSALREMLTALIVNAIEANARNVIVTVSGPEGSPKSQLTRPEVAIMVSDDGDGIPPEGRTDFIRSGRTTKGSRSHGIGLTIVELLSRQLGGRLELTSPGRSGGEKETVFVIWVPLAR